MREFTNLLWPEVPFGGDRRMWPHHVRLIASTYLLWADDGERAVPMAAGLVYLPVHRTKTAQLEPGMVHAGFRTLVATSERDWPELAAVVDQHLVQGRRCAQALAGHRFADDATALARFTADAAPGIYSVATNLADRAAADRGTAALVETAVGDADDVLVRTCGQRGLSVRTGPGGLLTSAQVQQMYDLIIGLEPSADGLLHTVQVLGLAAMTGALAVALLAAEITGAASWDGVLSLSDAASDIAWDVFPLAMPESAVIAAMAV